MTNYARSSWEKCFSGGVRVTDAQTEILSTIIYSYTIPFRKRKRKRKSLSDLKYDGCKSVALAKFSSHHSAK
jgi:hypothetical protein